jgi:hypothetical protein
MKSIANTLIVLMLVVLLALTVGCGKKSEESETEAANNATTAETVTGEAESLPAEAAPFAPEIQDGGYEIVYYNDYPGGAAGRKGKMILYQSASGGKDGGMVYVEQLGPKFEWVWHWYFEDASPKSLKRVEVNEDGMWDIQVTTTRGRHIDFIQDDTFTLVGGERRDKIALNATSSETVEGHPLWHCFDGNAFTAWKSSLEGREKPFIEVASPLGLEDGILSIRAMEYDQPRNCEIEADGKTVQSFRLESTTEEQLVQLDPKCRTAGKIRLVVRSCHGASRAAAIAELSIR